MTWSSAAPVGGVQIDKIYSIADGGLFILVQVKLTNTGASDLTDVYYMRTVDPDNNKTLNNSFITTNTIVSQPAGSNLTAAVSATQASPPSALFLAAQSSLARVIFGGPLLSVRSPSAVWNGTTGGQSAAGSTATEDKPISLAFKVDIAAGQHVDFAYVYNLASNADSAFSCLEVLNCGDSVVQGSEACDTGGASATCNADCTAAACGDGKRNAAAGEACDTGGASATCNADCTPAVCGDGKRNAAAGEDCDDGGDNGGQCSKGCVLISVGGGGCQAGPGSGGTFALLLALMLGYLGRRREPERGGLA